MSDNIDSGDKSDIADASAADVSASIFERALNNWIKIIVTTVFVFGALVVTDYIGWSPPDWFVPLLTTTAFLFIPFFIVGSYIVSKLVTDNRHVIIEIDARKPWATRIYLVSREAWKNKTVLDGTPYSHGNTSIKYVRHLEQTEDGVEVKGPWMGELTDVEIMTARKAIKANRGQLREWAQIGQNLYAGFPAVVQSVTASVWRKHSDDILEATEGQEALNIVQSHAVDQADRLTDSIETPDKQDVSDLADVGDQDQNEDNSPESGGGDE